MGLEENRLYLCATSLFENCTKLSNTFFYKLSGGF